MRFCAQRRQRISLISINLIVLILVNLSSAMYIPEYRAALESNLDSNQSIENGYQKSRSFKSLSFNGSSDDDERNSNELNPAIGFENRTSYTVLNYHNATEDSGDSTTDFEYDNLESENTDSDGPNDSTMHSTNFWNQPSPYRIKRSQSEIRTKRQALETELILQRPLALSTRTVRPAPRSTTNEKFVKPKTCGPTKKNINRTLGCYQCNFTYVPGRRQNGEQCDDKLWGVTSVKEKHKFRIRCPEEGGQFCAKKVQERKGGRVTMRGCMGPGPIVTEDKESIRLQPGCVKYRQSGYITTACLCSKDLCNTASRAVEGVFHAVVVIGLSVFVFYFSVLALQIQA